ncbi:hypothetical protein L9F63_013365 [Diploptera punctata]|uniref:MAGE domain-containing protein n=1 Tax=Diploptera punctata TaxID=6984 RepID=A0AAD8EMM9_DIPPU|nr:hypothetical protein L9F63_013365 [Diploptera punctata]
MWAYLTDLGIISSKKIHDYFGDVRKLLSVEFVRQMYVEFRRIPDVDPAKYEFRWGLRAEEEVSHYEILKFVSQLHGIEDMSVWTTQHKEMMKAESKKGRLPENESEEMNISD